MDQDASLLPAGQVCPNCNYDLRGNRSPQCPECGMYFDKTSVTQLNRACWAEAAAQQERMCLGCIGVTMALLLFGRQAGASDTLSYAMTPGVTLVLCGMARWMIDGWATRARAVDWTYVWLRRVMIGLIGYLIAVAALRLLAPAAPVGPLLIGLVCAGLCLHACWNMHRCEQAGVDRAILQSERIADRSWKLATVWSCAAVVLAGALTAL